MRALRLVAGLALAAALVGCSGDGDDDNEAKETTTPSSSGPGSDAPPASAGPEAGLETTYRKYVKAFLTGDGSTAYGLLSKRCRAATPLSEFAASSEAAAELYGLVDYEVKSVKIRPNGRGVIDAEYPVENLNRGGGSEWVEEDGSWKLDKCD